MKMFTLFIGLLLTCAVASSAPVRRLNQAVFIPSQSVLENDSIPATGSTAPIVQGTADVLSAHAGNTAAGAATATSFVAQPDVARNLIITPGGTTGDINNGCDITISGTNIWGSSITEVFSFDGDQTAAETGTKAFKTVTSVAFEAGCETGGFAATWSVGYGQKLGLDRCMAGNDIIRLTAGGLPESSGPTVTYDADEVEKNTVQVVGVLGTSTFNVKYVQNYGCFP